MLCESGSPYWFRQAGATIAQLAEHLFCKQDVLGSSPSGGYGLTTKSVGVGARVAKGGGL